MKRRGLNFLTEDHEQNLDMESIDTIEKEVDNIAPKIIGIMPLSGACDTKYLRDQMADYCLTYMQSLQPKKKGDMQADDLGVNKDSPFQAFICPNAGSSSNLASRKQRLIFLEIDRNDVYSVLDVGKVADLILMVMSSKETDATQLKVDPDQSSGAIDEQGYKALALLRSQGIANLIGVLQHLEYASSKRQPQIKKLFKRYFESEFTDRHKYMTVNALHCDADINALLRQIAVTYPEPITWRSNRSYMLGSLTKVDEANNELHISGYIKQNYLNTKRLVHITGVAAQQGFKVKQIEISKDPCPMKLGKREVEKVMSTSRAQSIVSSRMSSRLTSKRGSRTGSMEDEEPKTSRTEEKPRTQGGKIINRLDKGEERDSNVVEQIPDPFAAEQTYLTEADISQAQQRKGSYDEMDQDMPSQIDSSALTSAFSKLEQKPEEKDISQMLDQMQITVVGGGNEEEKQGSSSEDESEDDLDEDHFQEDVNKISQKHARHTDIETRDREDMDFPDEVDTPFKEARKRFQKYRGIKSLKTCDWDPYENLPPEYSKIFRFQNLQAEVKQVKDQVESEGLPINGTFITLVLEVENAHAYTELSQGKPLILSTLFPHECKVSTMHFKLKRTLENKEIVPSKSTMEFNCGFRRLVVKPTFSMELNASGKVDKFRYMRFLRKDMNVIATAYCPFVYQPCKVIAFTKQFGQPVNMDVVASGIALQPDPLKVILKRIVLTGYPLRCHKKRATIRYMFFDPKDIKYFKPVELYTQAGLRVSPLSDSNFFCSGPHQRLPRNTRADEVPFQRPHQTERRRVHAPVQACLPHMVREDVGPTSRGAQERDVRLGNAKLKS